MRKPPQRMIRNEFQKRTQKKGNILCPMSKPIPIGSRGKLPSASVGGAPMAPFLGSLPTPHMLEAHAALPELSLPESTPEAFSMVSVGCSAVAAGLPQCLSAALPLTGLFPLPPLPLSALLCSAV